MKVGCTRIRFFQDFVEVLHAPLQYGFIAMEDTYVVPDGWTEMETKHILVLANRIGHCLFDIPDTVLDNKPSVLGHFGVKVEDVCFGSLVRMISIDETVLQLTQSLDGVCDFGVSFDFNCGNIPSADIQVKDGLDINTLVMQVTWIEQVVTCKD